MIDFENADFLKLKQVDNSTYEDRLMPLFAPGEEIVASFRTVRDGVVFTNKRVITINVQGLTGKKTDYSSLPYKKVQAFSIETSGVFDLDSELELWFSSLGRIRFEFTAGADVARICSVISQYAL
ncbi:PH domain-containing protein [Pseudoflavonifractor sp. An85]|uniref:PH domain-containing protein n=1 Tax=Pseudoflavonifractor sp. An85 TaxID=1965661 RepID=UPI000B3976DB|nr:PH domain-containing protein [Pseudoflavonifractor sp. An85]OUN25395.1 cytoplasmic protein [Pseudoflavonifractor sp. An85]